MLKALSMRFFSFVYVCKFVVPFPFVLLEGRMALSSGCFNSVFSLVP